EQPGSDLVAEDSGLELRPLVALARRRSGQDETDVGPPRQRAHRAEAPRLPALAAGTTAVGQERRIAGVDDDVCSIRVGAIDDQALYVSAVEARVLERQVASAPFDLSVAGIHE